MSRVAIRNEECVSKSPWTEDIDRIELGSNWVGAGRLLRAEERRPRRWEDSWR